MWRISPSKVRQARIPVLNAAGLRIAELSARPVFARAAAFPASRWYELKTFGPNVLIGSAADLGRLIERMDLKTLELSCVDHAVFVATELGDKPLSDRFRVVLWQRFGVPVYEVYVGPERELLACECEALEGWHIEPDVRFVQHAGVLVLQRGDKLIPTGLDYAVDGTLCECGRVGMRMRPAAMIVPDDGLLAASA